MPPPEWDRGLTLPDSALDAVSKSGVPVRRRSTTNSRPPLSAVSEERTHSGETRTAASADGTTIAYQAYGEGPAVVIVGGATNRKEDWVKLAQALAEAGLTGVTYDRRGRGDSDDTTPYAVEREMRTWPR